MLDLLALGSHKVVLKTDSLFAWSERALYYIVCESAQKYSFLDQGQSLLCVMAYGGSSICHFLWGWIPSHVGCHWQAGPSAKCRTQQASISCLPTRKEVQRYRENGTLRPNRKSHLGRVEIKL